MGLHKQFTYLLYLPKFNWPIISTTYYPGAILMNRNKVSSKEEQICKESDSI